MACPAGPVNELGLSDQERQATLAALGVDAATYKVLARFSVQQRAALIAGEVEGLSPLDLELVLGTSASSARRRVSETRRLFLARRVAAAERTLAPERALTRRADSEHRRPGPRADCAMTDPHGRFFAWLLDGGRGDPPRDLAVHAALCATCMDWVAAHDALHRIDVGRAPLPPWHPTAMPHAAGLRQAGRFAAAAASMLLVGGAVVLGASQILAGRTGDGQEPTGGVLAASGSPGRSAATAAEDPSATAVSSESPSPTPTQTPRLAQPPATAYPLIQATQRLSATIRPSTASPASSAPASPAATPTPSPTPPLTPTPTPTPTPSRRRHRRRAERAPRPVGPYLSRCSEPASAAWAAASRATGTRNGEQET